MAPTTKKVKEKAEHKCPHCSKVLINRSSYLLHQKLHTDQYPFSCSICPYKCKIKNHLACHVKKAHSQAKGTDCPICGKVFLFCSNLKRHMWVHTDKKPFKCSFCAYSCRDISYLRKHEERHTRICKTYPCKKTYTSKPCLLTHMKKIHSKNSEKFVCDECGSVNYSRRAIIMHLRYGHGSEQDRKCQICSAILTNSNDLTDHYWKTHNVRYVVQKTNGDQIAIKDEPIEDLAQYDFNYDVQKVEVDEEYIPDPQYPDTETTLAYSERVLAEDISRNILERDKGHQTESEFDDFVQVMNKPKKKGARVPEKSALATHTRDAEEITSTPFSEDCRDSVKGIIDSDVRDSSSSCNNIQSYICDKCKTVFNDKILLRAHIREHSVTGDKPYKCDVCMKCFRYKHNLDTHNRVHTGDKPYKCDVCMKCYRYKRNLHTHNRVHTGDKLYKCDVCMKCFTAKNMLNRHYRIHTDDKPYKCDVCMKCFRYKHNLDTHNRVHIGDKPYKCDVCMKCYRYKHNLDTHNRVHTGDKLHKCDVCMKCFTQKSNLVTHFRLHTGDKPYKCDVCMKCFTQKGTLITHYRQHTDDKPQNIE